MPIAKTALASLLALLAASTTVSAQSGRASLGPSDLGTPQWAEDAPGGYAGPAPAGWEAGPIGVPGAMFQPQYGTMPPQALYPPQAPNTMNPWPEVSPFYPPNVAYTQHVNKNGLWMKKTVHRQTDYEAGVEYIMTSFKKPSDRLVGSPFQPTVFQSGNIGSITNVGPVIYTYSLAQTPSLDTASFVFPGAFPFPFLLQTDLATRVALDGNYFPIHTTSALQGSNNSDGLKLRWGMMHEDGTGWAASAFYAPETTMQFQRGTDSVFGVPITQNMLVSSTGFPAEMSAIIFTGNGAVPLIYSDDLYGFDHVGGYLGETQKYDLLYRLQHNTTAAGTELNRYTGLLRETDNTKITSFVGARYFYLSENFSFRGLDSGLSYDFITDPTDPNYLRPDSGTIVVDYPLFDSRLNSRVQSHMAGPQAGFRIDIGHKGAFHVWTQTTGGLLANYERLEVNGNNIGVPGFGQRADMHDGLPADPPFPNGQFLDNSFRSQKNQMHVSPMFEQSIYADVRLRNVLPFLKKNYFLEEAQFRVGYTFTWVGLVSRPGSSINWVGFPKFPSVKINRENFSMDQLSLGLTFPY